MEEINMSNKNTYENIKSYIQEQKYILISTEYKNTHSKLELVCPKGHRFWMSYSNFKQGQRCPECANKKRGQYLKLTYHYVKNYIEQYGYKLLSKKYKNNSTKLEIQCLEGHVFWMNFSNFQQGKRCPECANKKSGQYRKFTYNYVKNYIEEYGYKLLDEKYINCDAKMKLQCAKGHVFWASFYSFKFGHRCPKCANNIKYTNNEIILKLKFCENVRENEENDIEVT